MKTKSIITVLVVFTVVAIVFFVIYKKEEKKGIVDAIFLKYGKEPSFDASREGLMLLDITTLKGVLDGTIH